LTKEKKSIKLLIEVLIYREENLVINIFLTKLAKNGVIAYTSTFGRISFFCKDREK
jgi:hypothetical protein